MPSVEVITRWDEDGLERIWRRLVADDPCATVFQTWEWNNAWWRVFGAGRRLLLLLALGSQGPLAMAPLLVRRTAGGLFRRVEFVGTGVSDYLGFIGASETMPGCADAFARTLLAYSQWDVADFQQLSGDQAARCGWGDAGPATGSWDGSVTRWKTQDVCPVMVLPAKWDSAQRQFGKKLRYNIGYYERLLCRSHEVAFDIADQEASGEALEEFFDLHERRWRKRHLPGAVYSRRLLEFHRRAAPALAASGRLALHRLRVDGRTVAALYCFHHGERAFYYLGGFEPTLSRYSPGTLLTARAVRYAIEAGCREFDFLRGQERYKYRWPVEERRNWRLEVGRKESRRSLMALRWNAWQWRAQQVGKEMLQKIYGGKEECGS